MSGMTCSKRKLLYHYYDYDYDYDYDYYLGYNDSSLPTPASNQLPTITDIDVLEEVSLGTL